MDGCDPDGESEWNCTVRFHEAQQINSRVVYYEGSAEFVFAAPLPNWRSFDDHPWRSLQNEAYNRGQRIGPPRVRRACYVSAGTEN